MKVVNQKGKLFGLINIIDLFVLLLIVAILLVGGTKLAGKFINKATVPEVKLEDYTVLYKSAKVHETLAKAFKKGEQIYYSAKGFINAEIIDVKYEDAVETVYTSDGSIVLSKHPTLKDLYVTLKIASDPDNITVSLAGNDVVLGGVNTIKTTRAQVLGTVMDIQPK